jgi:hypothetical protein
MPIPDKLPDPFSTLLCTFRGTGGDCGLAAASLPGELCSDSLPSGETAGEATAADAGCTRLSGVPGATGSARLGDVACDAVVVAARGASTGLAPCDGSEIACPGSVATIAACHVYASCPCGRLGSRRWRVSPVAICTVTCDHMQQAEMHAWQHRNYCCRSLRYLIDSQ